jgi:carbon storage regulator
MLVLSRKVDERIVFNPGTADEIVLTVLRTAGGSVRLGIDAPANVLILREELIGKQTPGIATADNATTN